jgi:hypothetical protein
MNLDILQGEQHCQLTMEDFAVWQKVLGSRKSIDMDYAMPAILPLADVEDTAKWISNINRQNTFFRDAFWFSSVVVCVTARWRYATSEVTPRRSFSAAPNLPRWRTRGARVRQQN